MITIVLLALIGFSALNSNTSSVTDWTKQTMASFSEASVTPVIAPTDGRYLAQGPKEIVWSSPEMRPGAFSLPVVIPVIAKEIAQNPQGSGAVETVSIGRKQLGGVDDLGILGARGSNLGVNADEILSYFEKKPTSKLRDTENNNATPSQNKKPDAPRTP